MIHLAALDAAKTELYSAFQASGLKKLAAPRPDTLCCNSDLLPVHPAGVGNESGYGFTVARDHDLFAFYSGPRISDQAIS